MQDVLESDIMAISAPFLSSNVEYDCSNAKHRYSALVCKGKDVGFVSDIGFEACAICARDVTLNMKPLELHGQKSMGD
jgi:hypothetical protein